MILDLDQIWFFLLLLPIVAFLYASVGHGGASGYLALMAMFSFTPETMKPTALLLNLFVAGIAFYHYNKEGYFNKKLFWSFAMAYSRIYLGVHYPLDIVCGMAFGALSGFMFYKLSNYLINRFISV